MFKICSYYRHLSSCNKTFSCGICDYDTKSKKSFKKHVRSEHPTKKKCTKCNFVSEHKTSINRHSRLVHGDKYKCDQCGKKIPLSTAEKHKELHGKLYECNLCRKFFKLSNSFE